MKRRGFLAGLLSLPAATLAAKEAPKDWVDDFIDKADKVEEFIPSPPVICASVSTACGVGFNQITIISGMAPRYPYGSVVNCDYRKDDDDAP